jgi:molybdopterin-containing oxidoreductase family iron-sulfur binding subunit
MRLKSQLERGYLVTVDAKIKSSIADAKAKGGQVVLLTNTLASPSTEKLIADFIAATPNAKHVIYDAVLLKL